MELQTTDMTKLRTDILKRSRIMKDNNLLRKQNKIAELLTKSQQSLPPELTEMYISLNQSYKRLNYAQMTSNFINLLIYAQDHYVDYDYQFSNYEIESIIFYSMSVGRPLQLRESALGFLVNIIRNPNSIYLENAIQNEKGIIPIMVNFLQTGPMSLILLSLQCLANIASDSIETRNLCMHAVPFDLLHILFDKACLEVKKEVANLLTSFCLFPLKDSEFKQLFMGMIQCLYISGPLSHLIINATAELARYPDNSKIITDDFMVYVQLIESYLSHADTKLVKSSLRFLCQLIASTPNDKSISIDFARIFDLLYNQDDEIQVYALRLLSNAIISNEEICDLICNNVVHPTKLSILIEKFNNGCGKCKVESAFVISHLVRQCNATHYLEIINSHVVNILVSALYIEDPDLTEDIICALARLMTFESISREKSEVRKQFNEVSGNEVIEHLCNSKEERISELATTFNDLCISKPRERQPFIFTLE